MRRLIPCVVVFSVLAATIVWAHEREQMRSDEYLQERFDVLNALYFQGFLHARVRWGYLDYNGTTERFGDEVVVKVNRGADAQEVLRHEACHVFVDWKESEEHGEMFQACMLRFANGSG